MKLTEYLGVSSEVLQDYINRGLVDTQHHPEFPLVIFTYGRKCVSEQAWDGVTTKCRGLIVREDTDEIIARPFEKFFNYGDPQAGLQLAGGRTIEEDAAPGSSCIFNEPDTIFEKVDGFLCTLYEWEGKKYVASKGSFDSPHAKWATATYVLGQKAKLHEWPEGYTPVFEGVTKNLRIVVDYGDREELVLIGLVNIETGEELNCESLEIWAKANGFTTPKARPGETFPLKKAAEVVLDPTVKNVEGFVAVWYRPGMTPFRLKLKYQDYLRIHRLVTGVSPKRVLEALMNGWTSELKEWTDESTPWFNKFVNKWKTALETKYTDLEIRTATAYTAIQAKAYDSVLTLGTVGLWNRKQWAEAIKEHPEELHSVLFALHDGKDIKPFIWKRVKPMISGSHPMVDAAKL